MLILTLIFQINFSWKDITVHSKNRTTCSRLLKTALNNVVNNVVNNIVQYCWAWISLRSGVTMLNNIVSKTEQCRQYNIVQCMLFSTGLQLSLQMPIPQPIFKRNPIAYWSAKETNYVQQIGVAGRNSNYTWNEGSCICSEIISVKIV